jgi:hypothetical protein
LLVYASIGDESGALETKKQLVQTNLVSKFAAIPVTFCAGCLATAVGGAGMFLVGPPSAALLAPLLVRRRSGMVVQGVVIA